MGDSRPPAEKRTGSETSMSVLIVIDSLAVGGAEQSLSILAPYIVKAGIELHVGYLKDRTGIGESLTSNGVVIHNLDGPGGRIRGIFRTVRLMKVLAPDLVHTILFESDVVARIAARIAGVPVVSSFVTESYGPEHLENPEYRRWKVRGAQIADALTARLVRRFHAVSTNSADVMSERLRLPRHKIEVIPRGRDLNRLGGVTAERRKRTRRSLGIEDDTPLIVAAARHYHMKGLDLLVGALGEVSAAIPTARLFIAGRSGPATEELRQVANSQGTEDMITFGGYRDDVPDLMAAADVIVVPSRAEGSPGVLIEAMALGVPVVATDIPSVREVAGAGRQTVLLVPTESTKDLAIGIIRVLEDSEFAQVIASAAKERFLNHYTIDTVADEMIAFYKRSVGAI